MKTLTLPLKADAERLDWIELQGSEFVHGLAVDDSHDGEHYVIDMNCHIFHGKTLRDAIDKARSAL